MELDQNGLLEENQVGKVKQCPKKKHPNKHTNARFIAVKRRLLASVLITQLFCQCWEEKGTIRHQRTASSPHPSLEKGEGWVSGQRLRRVCLWKLQSWPGITDELDCPACSMLSVSPSQTAGLAQLRGTNKSLQWKILLFFTPCSVYFVPLEGWMVLKMFLLSYFNQLADHRSPEWKGLQLPNAVGPDMFTQ